MKATDLKGFEQSSKINCILEGTKDRDKFSGLDIKKSKLSFTDKRKDLTPQQSVVIGLCVRQGWEQDDRENRDQLYLRRMEGHGNEGCGKVSQDMVQTAQPWKSGTWRLVHFVLPTNCMALGKSSCASPFFFFFLPV